MGKIEKKINNNDSSSNDNDDGGGGGSGEEKKINVRRHMVRDPRHLHKHYITHKNHPNKA